MRWLIMFLIIIIVILVTLIFRYKRDIKYISKQITKNKDGYPNIRINTLDKDIENLVLCINDLYEKNQKINIKVRHREEELRRSIANLSHDLRTPLTSIMGYMQLVKTKNLRVEDSAKYIDIIERRTVTLQSLITSFFELSRIESNEYKFDLKAVNLSDLLCETIALFYNDFVNKAIEPDIKVNEKVPSIIADEKAVMRIFSNLIDNMLKYGEKNVIIALRKEKDYIVTEFKNYAPNLKGEHVEHIFDRFFTADLARSDKHTGLGLSITKALVEHLGHKIEAVLNDGMLIIKIIWK
ncbi:MAG: sensor histidine kinase [Clostridium sp.]|uniref:sensor histidine kinase n=1 Tax=Clostridium sp. TaxID=1506 RepID=UPI003D6C94A0